MIPSPEARRRGLSTSASKNYLSIPTSSNATNVGALCGIHIGPRAPAILRSESERKLGDKQATRQFQDERSG